MFRTVALLSIFACLASSVPVHAAAPTKATTAGYHVVKGIPLGGEGGWDYLTVDAAARRLYVSHSTKVTVLDADTGKTVGDVQNLSGVHGIALAGDLGRGFISNGRSSLVTIF